MINAFFAVRDLVLRTQPLRHTLGPFRARLVRGAECVVFSADWQGGKFLGTAQVTEVRDTTEGERRVQLAQFSSITPFDHPRELSVIGGSLDKVKYVLEPQRHFKRNILKISRRDFSTITANEVDVRRSVFRYLFAALPMAVQTVFLQGENVDLEKFYADEGASRQGLDEAILSFMKNDVLPQFELVAGVAYATANINVRGMPSVRELVMTDGRGENPVALGRLSGDVGALLRVNALFSEGGNRPPLLAEGMRQIHGQD